MREAILKDEETGSDFILRWKEGAKDIKLFFEKTELVQITSLDSLKQGVPFTLPTGKQGMVRFIHHPGPVNDYIEIEIDGRKIKGRDESQKKGNKMTVIGGLIDLITAYF